MYFSSERQYCLMDGIAIMMKAQCGINNQSEIAISEAGDVIFIEKAKSSIIV